VNDILAQTSSILSASVLLPLNHTAIHSKLLNTYQWLPSHRHATNLMWQYYTVFQKSDAKIQITITMAYLNRIKCPLSDFNYHLSDVNIGNFNKIHRTVSEQQPL